jgi:enoyl-CoA hydratase/carnithine racemase
MALLDVQVACLANQASNYLVGGKPPVRMGNAHPNIVPYQDFPTRDGYMVIATGNDAQFTRLCEAAGHADLARDPRYADNKARVANRVALIEAMNAFTVERHDGRMDRLLEEAGVPCGPINDLAQVFADPHVQARGLRQTLDKPDVGAVPFVASPIRLSATPVQYRMAPPLLGEHTREVLRDLLHFTDQDIDRLAAAARSEDTMASFIDLRIADGIAVMTLNSPETRNVLGFDGPRARSRPPARRSPPTATCAPWCSPAPARPSAPAATSSRCWAGWTSRPRAGGRPLLLQGRHPPHPARAVRAGSADHRSRQRAAVGAGLDLACMCDIRIAAEGATFAESFVRLGIIPGDGGAFLLQRLVGSGQGRGDDVHRRGDRRAEALACGLVTKVVPPADLMPTAMDLARRIAVNPPHALRMAKRLMRESQHLRLDTVLELSAAFQALAHSSSDHRDRVTAAVEAISRKR